MEELLTSREKSIHAWFLKQDFSKTKNGKKRKFVLDSLGTIFWEMRYIYCIRQENIEKNAKRVSFPTLLDQCLLRSFSSFLFLFYQMIFPRKRRERGMNTDECFALILFITYIRK